MDSTLYGVLSEAIRIVFLLGLPIIAASAVAGLLAGAFQSATSIQEPVIGYAARALAVASVLYLLLPGAVKNLMSLAAAVFD